MRTINKGRDRITSAQIAAILRGSFTTTKHWLHDGGGLYLRPNPGMGGYWVFRYTRDGKNKKIGLGPLAYIGAAEARDQAYLLRKSIRAGGDPQPERRIAQIEQRRELNAQADAVSRTFNDEALEWIARRKDSSQTIKNFKRWAKQAEPTFGAMHIDTIQVTDIASTLRKMTFGDMNRARQFFSRVCSYALVCKRAKLNPVDKAAIAELLDDLKKPVSDGEESESMPWPEVPAVVAQLVANPAPRAQALLMAILSGVRAQEVYGARWTEFDLKRREWTVPAARMKERLKHVVPISDAMLDVLNRLGVPENRTGYVFPGQSPGSHVAPDSMRKLLQEDLGYEGRTVRGFRSSLRNWGAEMVDGRNRFANDAMECCLAHKVATGVAGHYYNITHYPERVTILAEWGVYCTATAPVPVKTYPHLRVAS